MVVQMLYEYFKTFDIIDLQQNYTNLNNWLYGKVQSISKGWDINGVFNLHDVLNQNAGKTH